jgi:hypothetical protein
MFLLHEAVMKHGSAKTKTSLVNESAMKEEKT